MCPTLSAGRFVVLVEFFFSKKKRDERFRQTNDHAASLLTRLPASLGRFSFVVPLVAVATLTVELARHLFFLYIQPFISTPRPQEENPVELNKMTCHLLDTAEMDPLEARRHSKTGGGGIYSSSSHTLEGNVIVLTIDW